MKNKTLTLGEFRRRTKLNDLQKQLLEQTWQHFRGNGEWSVLREFYSQHDKEPVVKALNALSGNIGREDRSSSQQWNAYRLSLLGVLLTKDGLAYESLLLNFLNFQRDQCKKEPLKTHFPTPEIVAGLKLAKDEVPLLGQLLSLAGLGGSQQPREDWGASVMRESEDFFSPKCDLKLELDKLVFRYYEPNALVFDEDRQRMPISSLPLVAKYNLPTSVGFEAEISTPPKAYRPGTAFIIMWMDKAHPELDDVVDAIKEVCREFKIKAVRADDIEHQNRITDVILRHINESEFLIADLSGERPNVYYEVGYAHAVGKYPILFRREQTSIHFDLAGHNVPSYRNVVELKKLLRQRFHALTGRKPKTSRGKNDS